MTRTAPRGGFTLVELLVAVALAIVILGLAIYIVNTATFDSYKVVGAGDRVSQWLMQAKNRALRDKLPRGVRFFVTAVDLDPNLPNDQKRVLYRASECAFIEQPEPLNLAADFPNARVILHYPATPGTPPPTPPPPVLDQANRKVYLAGVPSNQWNNQIKQGDTLYFPDLRVAVRATGVTTLNAPYTNYPGRAEFEITVDPAGLPDLGAAHSLTTLTPAEFSGTVGFPFATGGVVVYRQPELIMGEPNMQLPEGMVVDFVTTERRLPPQPSPPWGVVAGTRHSTNIPFNVDPTTLLAADRLLNQANGPRMHVDILFAPSGDVIGATSGYLGLLLRDANKFPADPTMPAPMVLPANYDQAGEMVIVSIYTRTGAIATHPVANDPDPHKYAKDAVNSGL